MKVRKGDKVQVLLGKDRGRSGSVERVFSKQGLVAVAGINVYKRHVRKQGNPSAGGAGGIIDIIKPVKLSNVAVICATCGKPTRVGFELVDKTKKRICKRCKAVI